MKLQLFLSHSGFCSRRQAMSFIQQGNVLVNGKMISEPSTMIDPIRDKIYVNGTRIRLKNYRYVLLNKPKGFVTTTKDPHAQKTVLKLLPRDLGHLNPVGRLDKETEGLLLFTNDGDIAYRLTHPKFNVSKTYFVVINGYLKTFDKKKLENGLLINGKKTAPARIICHQKKESGTQLTLTIHEGKKRQIRLMFAQLGYRVVRLKRLSQGPLSLGQLQPGQWRFLSEKEIQMVQKI